MGNTCKANMVIAAVLTLGLVIVDDVASGLAKTSLAATQIQSVSDQTIVQETALRQRAVAALQALALRQ